MDTYPTIHPLTDGVEWSEFCRWDHSRRRWVITARVRIVLDGYNLVTWLSRNVHTYAHTIDLFPGFAWDGASGIAFDNPDAVIASLVHDVVCTRYRPDRCKLAGYIKRHRLYTRILWRQGANAGRAYRILLGIRCGYSFAALVAGNWLWEAMT